MNFPPTLIIQNIVVIVIWRHSPISFKHDVSLQCLLSDPHRTNQYRGPIKKTSHLRATSHMRLRAHDHYTSSTLIGGEGGAGPSSLHTTTRRNCVHFNLGHRDSWVGKCINKSIWLAPGRYPWCTHGRCPPVANQIDLFMHFLGASRDGLVARPVEMDTIPSSVRLRDQQSMWMQDGCKVYMDSYMAWNGSCFIITWTIFKNHLLKVGLTQN